MIVSFFLSLFTESFAADVFKSRELTERGQFTRGIEGPAVDSQGNLYVVNFAKDGTIGIIQPQKKPGIWVELPEAGLSSAIRFDSKGEMFVADRKHHRILKFDLKSKKHFVVATNSAMNQPNDFTISRSGKLYFSDPSWSSKKKGSIWIFKDRQFKVAATDLKAVNGIDLNPQETVLYFTESIGGGLWSFDVHGDQLKNKKLIYQFKKDTVDGLRVDQHGVIYVARIGEGRVDCISSAGKLIRSVVLVGREPTNLAFGGPDGKTVFVSMRDTGAIETFQVEVPGREWVLQKGP